MKKSLIAVLSASIIFSGVSTGFSNKASAEEPVRTFQVVEKQKKVAYDKSTILAKMEGSSFPVTLPYKKGIVEVPEGYVYSVITNPETNQSFYKVEAEMQAFGLKKTAIVALFRYGGKGLGNFLESLSPKTGTYVKKNSGKIADAIDDASELIEGELLQSLISAGVPRTYAKNIAWGIVAILL